MVLTTKQKLIFDDQYHVSNNSVLKIEVKAINSSVLQISYKHNNILTTIVQNFSSSKEKLDIKALIPNFIGELYVLSDGSITIDDCSAPIDLDITSNATVLNNAKLNCNSLKLHAKNLLIKNSINSKQGCDLFYENKLENYAKITTKDSLYFDSAATAIMNNFGIIDAGKDVHISNQNSKIINHGLICSDHNLTIKAKRLYNYNTILSPCQISCFGKELINSGTICSEKRVGLRYSNYIINMPAGIIKSNKSLKLFMFDKNSSIFINQGKILSINNLILHNHIGITINEEQAKLRADQMNLSGAQFINAGKIFAENKLKIIFYDDTGYWYNKSNSIIDTNYLDCVVTKIINDGYIRAQKEFEGSLKILMNQSQGQIVSYKMRVTALEKITNDCLMQVNEQLKLFVKLITINPTGRLVANQINIDGQQIENLGVIKAVHSCSVVTERFDNLIEGKVSVKELKLAISAAVINNLGIIKSKTGTIDLRAINNFNQRVYAKVMGNLINITSAEVKLSGDVAATVSAVISAAKMIIEQNGQVTSEDNIQFVGQRLFNSGSVVAKKKLKVNMQDQVVQTTTGNIKVETATINVGRLENNGVLSVDSLTLRADILKNLYNAIIESTSTLTLEANELQNSGIIEAYGQLQLKILACLDNLAQGHINAVENLIIEAGSILKNSGFINSEAEAFINLGDTLSNAATGIITAKKFELTGGWKLDNYGSILAQSKLHINLKTVINNYQSGTILCEQALSLINSSLNNHGSITANNLELFAQTILTNHRTGKITTTDALNLLGAKLILNSGEIISEDNLNIKAIEVLENLTTGKISAQAGLNIIGKLLVENNGILAANQLKLAASQLLLNGELHSKELSTAAEHITGDGIIDGGAINLIADLLRFDGQLIAGALNIEAKNYLQLLKNGSITCKEASKLITQAGFVNLGKILNHDKLAIVAEELFHNTDAVLDAKHDLYIQAINAYLDGEIQASQNLFLLIANQFEYNTARLTADGELCLTLKDNSQIKYNIDTSGDLKIEFLTNEGIWYNNKQLKAGGTLTLDIPGFVFINGIRSVNAALKANKALNVHAKKVSTGRGIIKARDVRVQATGGITVNKHGTLSTHNLGLHTKKGAIELQQALKFTGDIELLATQAEPIIYVIADATGAIKQFKPTPVAKADGADALATIYKLTGTKEVGWAARIKASRQLKEHIKEPTVRKLVMEEIKAALLSAPDVASLATIGFKITAEEMELLGYYKLAHSSSQTSASDQKLLEEELQKLVASKLLMYLDCAIEKSKFWFGLAAGSSGIMGAVAHINDINFNIFTDTNGQSQQAKITKLCTHNTRPHAPIHNIYVTVTKSGSQFAVLTEIIANENPTNSTIDVEQPITAKTVKVVADGKITVTSQIEAEADNLIQSLCGDVEIKSLKERRGNHENFDDYIVSQARVVAGKLLSIKGINIILQKAETASGEAGTHIQALANILDVSVDLLSQRVQHFYEKRKSGYIRDTYLRQNTSLHQSKGNFNSFAGNSSSYYAPTIEAQEATIASVNDTTLFADVHDRHEHHKDIRTKKKRWYGGSKKTHKQSSSVQATSQGTRFKVKKLKVSGANVELRHVHSSAEHNLFAAPNGKVSILQGENRVASVNIFTSSEPLWQKQSSRQEKHTTYSASTFTGTIEIEAKSAELEVVCGRVLDFLNQITLKPEDTIYKTLYEHHEVHSESKEGPGPALIALVALAVTIATQGTASGWSTALLNGATTGPMHAALAAGFQSIMAQAASVIVANNGDLEQALKDLCQKDTLKKLATSMLSAGLMDKVASGLDLPKTALTRSMPQNVAYNLTKATVDAGLAAGISGKDFAKTLQENLINAAFATLGNKIDLLTNISEDHSTLLHAMLGITRGTVNKDGWLVGMIESIISARLPKYIEKLKLKRQLKEQLDSERKQKTTEQAKTTKLKNNKNNLTPEQEKRSKKQEQLLLQREALKQKIHNKLSMLAKIEAQDGRKLDVATIMTAIDNILDISDLTRLQELGNKFDNLFNVTFDRPRFMPAAYDATGDLEESSQKLSAHKAETSQTTWWERFKENYVQVTNSLDGLEQYDIEGNHRAGQVLLGASTATLELAKTTADLALDFIGGVVKLSVFASKVQEVYAPEDAKDLYTSQHEQLKQEVEATFHNTHKTLSHIIHNPGKVAKIVGHEIWDNMTDRCKKGSDAWEKQDYFEASRQYTGVALEMATLFLGVRAVGKATKKLGKAAVNVATEGAISLAQNLPKDARVVFQYDMLAHKAAFQEVIAGGTLTKKGVPIIPKTASTAVKGAGAESVPRGINGWFLGKELPCKLPGNKGFDGMFVRETRTGSVEKIFITETKYQAKGGRPRLSRTKTKELQMSTEWTEKTLKAMERSADSALQATAKLIRQNPEKIVYKVNVVTPEGINKWYTVRPTKDGVIINPPRAPPQPRPHPK